MANRNRVTGGYPNRRNDFGDYNRFSRDGYGGAPRGPQFGGVNPWQGAPAPVQASTETTIALASNLINNLLQSRNSNVPSLLDINVRRDFGGYSQGFQADRRGLNRMGGRNLNQGGGGMNRRPLQPRHNTAPRKPKHPQSQAKQVKKEDQASGDAGADGEIKTEDGAEGAAEDTEKKDAKTPYDDINPMFLECHICEKKMWDGRSFDNHVKGRAHFIMMEKIRESYKMTADAMRQEQRISEMRKDRRGFQQQRKVFCAMCDLYVVAEGAHRRSAGHQKLKRYLHPACNTCRLEMPTRIEFEEHRLTPQHMKVLQEKQKDQDPELKAEVMQMFTMQDELALVRPQRNRQRKQNPAKAGEGEAVTVEGEVTVKEEGAEGEGEGEVKQEGMEQEPAVEGPYLILDYQDDTDLSEMTRENLPKYQSERGLGASFIRDYTCRQCTLCRKLFDSEETAEVHTRTFKHFQSFLRLLHSKGNFKNKDNNKREVPKEEGENDGEGQDWKRRKLDDGEAPADGDYQNGDAVGDDSIVNDGGLNGDEVMNSSQDDALLADDTLNDSENVPMESEPIEEPQEEVVEKPVPKPVQQSPRGRGRGRGRGRSQGRNRI